MEGSIMLSDYVLDLKRVGVVPIPEVQVLGLLRIESVCEMPVMNASH